MSSNPPPSSGEVSASYADGGGKRRGRFLRFQIMIGNLRTMLLRLSPSVADYRATSPDYEGGKVGEFSLIPSPVFGGGGAVIRRRRGKATRPLSRMFRS